jgi:hypothetical protein
MRRGYCFLQGVLLLVMGVALCSGCGAKTERADTNSPSGSTELEITPAPETSSPLPMPSTETVPPTATPTIPPTEPQPDVPAPSPPPSETDSAPAFQSSLPDPPATPDDTVKAGVGVGQAGRSLDNLDAVQDTIAYPAKAYFAIREKVKFEVEIPGAYKLYRATDEPPLTFAEFKEKVLDPNNIKLPNLPPGHSYEWDPEKEELLVRQPKK